MEKNPRNPLPGNGPETLSRYHLTIKVWFD
jgi:hypothetical protein